MDQYHDVLAIGFVLTVLSIYLNTLVTVIVALFVVSWVVFYIIDPSTVDVRRVIRWLFPTSTFHLTYYDPPHELETSLRLLTVAAVVFAFLEIHRKYVHNPRRLWLDILVYFLCASCVLASMLIATEFVLLSALFVSLMFLVFERVLVWRKKRTTLYGLNIFTVSSARGGRFLNSDVVIFVTLLIFAVHFAYKIDL